MQKILAAKGAIETVTPLSVVTWSAENVVTTGADGSDRVLALFGEAQGGIPAFPYTFTDPVTASKTLLSGDLLRGVQYAFANGAPDGARPRAVIAVNAKPGSPATYAVKDSAAKTLFTLTTLTYREAANQTTLTLTGSRSAGFNLQIKDPVTGAALGYTKLGVGLYAQYIGGGKAATAEVLLVAGQKHLKTTVTGGAAGEGVLIPLAGLTMRELAQRLQDSGPYNVYTARSAVLKADGLDVTAAASIMTYGVAGEASAAVTAGATTLTLKAAPSRTLNQGETLKFRQGGVWRYFQVAEDTATTTVTITPLASDIPANAVILDSSTAAPVGLSAVKADFEDFLTGRGQAVVKYAAGDATAGDPVVQGGNFTGGGSSSALIRDWETAVESSLDEDYGSAVALTDDQGVVFGVRARLQAARGPKEGKFVQLFSGIDSDLLPNGESDADLSAFLQNVSSSVGAINDRDSVVIAQAADAVNPQTGRVERVAPYFHAAVVAGYAASVGRNVALTNKVLATTNPYPNLRTRKDEFTLAGVTVLTTPKKGQASKVELGRTAYVGEDNTIYELEKGVRVMNGIARDLRLIQDKLVPGESSAAAIGKYKRALTDYFEGLKTAGVIQDGYDQEGNFVSAYEFEVGRTTNQGRKVTTTAKVNPVLELVVSDLDLRARPVEIQV